MKNLLQVEMVMVEKLEGKRAKVVGTFRRLSLTH